MVDVAAKESTHRRAVATAEVVMDADTRVRLLAGQLQKGEALGTARIAGILAAKDTARLIPLCHPLPLRHVGVAFAPVGDDRLLITAEASTVGPTGVEMEAMVAASVAGLCVYDMIKGHCRGAQLAAVRLRHKSGGKSGSWNSDAAPLSGGGGQ